jgi:hypothetical protein
VRCPMPFELKGRPVTLSCEGPPPVAGSPVARPSRWATERSVVLLRISSNVGPADRDLNVGCAEVGAVTADGVWLCPATLGELPEEPVWLGPLTVGWVTREALELGPVTVGWLRRGGLELGHVTVGRLTRGALTVGARKLGPLGAL